jgi:DNA-binding MarR family transcriptional regulator
MRQETSRLAYRSIEDELGERQMQVLGVVSVLHVACNLDIADQLNLPINSVTPRVKELREKGLIVEHSRAICPQTNRLVMYWTTKKGQQALFN